MRYKSQLENGEVVMGVAAEDLVFNTKGVGGSRRAVQFELVLVQRLADVGRQLPVPTFPPLSSLLLKSEAALDLARERERERERETLSHHNSMAPQDNLYHVLLSILYTIYISTPHDLVCSCEMPNYKG